MSYEIVNRLKTQSREDLLSQLSSFVNNTDRKKGKKHEVFEPSFDWKECWDSKFIEQKLDYIHDNPCSSHWELVVNPIDYIHSSARWYIEGKQGVYQIKDYTEMEDIDLSR